MGRRVTHWPVSKVITVTIKGETVHVRLVEPVRTRKGHRPSKRPQIQIDGPEGLKVVGKAG